MPEKSHRAPNVITFTKSKSGDPATNEDLFDHDGRTFVMADGSTPKSGNAKELDGRSGGVIAARLVVAATLESDGNGPELIGHINARMQRLYRDRHPEALDNPRAAFAATLVAARIIPGEQGDVLVVTRVGDTGFRINGGKLITEEREQDRIDALARSAEIKRALAEGNPLPVAAALGRKAIEPSLNNQWQLWNNADHPQGFGYVNGHPVPDRFARTYTFPLAEVQTLELVTDGYPKSATEPTIESWEQAYAAVQAADPYRYIEYLSTKPADDRTVAVISF